MTFLERWLQELVFLARPPVLLGCLPSCRVLRKLVLHWRDQNHERGVRLRCLLGSHIVFNLLFRFFLVIVLPLKWYVDVIVASTAAERTGTGSSGKKKRQVRVRTANLQLAQLTVSGNKISYSCKNRIECSSNMDFVCFVDSGDCTGQGISGVSDVPEAEHAAVGPVLASEYLYHDHVHCFFSQWDVS